MASEILGLFTSPEEYQMRQQQAQQQGQQNAAFQFAQLNPFEKANYGIFQGAQQLGSAGRRLFGGEDPQLRKISIRQALSQEIDPSNPESIMRVARKAAQLDDISFALQLSDHASKMQSEIALAQQRGRVPVPEKIEAGRELHKLVLQKEGLLAQGIGANSPQVRALEAEINTLQRVVRGDKIPEVIEISAKRAQLLGEIDTLTAQHEATPTPETAQKILDAKRQLEGLPLPGDKASADAQVEVIDRQLANPEMSSQERANLEARRDKLLGVKNPAEKELEQSRLLIEAGYTKGSPDYITEMRKFVSAEQTGRGKGKGTQVDIGGISIGMDKAGEAAGKIIGEKLAGVPEKQSALDSLSDAQSMLKQGIYAGGYGAAGKFAAKYTGIGSADKLARTEAFTAYIGNVVIPRLRDFGGSDSNEELKYLRSVTGGDIDLEPKALKLILEQAERNIKRGMERLRTQAEGGEAKKPLSTLVPRGVDNTKRPSESAMTMPTATKRWNPQTRKLEVIK